MWQDIVFMFGGFVFTAALIPSIVKRRVPSSETCAITGGVLAVYSYAFLTLGMSLSFIGTLSSVIAWCILFVRSSN